MIAISATSSSSPQAHANNSIKMMQLVAVATVLLLQGVFVVESHNDSPATEPAAPDQVVQSPDDTEVRLNEISRTSLGVARNRCEDDLDRCSAQLIAFGQPGKPAGLYPTSMDELNNVYCPSFKGSIDCIKNSTECFKPFERQIINWILSSTRRMNHKRCKNDQEKQKFLKLTHACFMPMRDPMDRCMSKYIAQLEAIADLEGGLGSLVSGREGDDDLQIQLSCCANLKFKQCVMNNAKQQCKPLDSMKKLKRTNSNTSQHTARRSMKRAMADMMEDVQKTMDGMALTGPEFICQMVDEQFCRTNFEGKLHVRAPRHRSIVPAMLRIYSNNKQE